MLTNEALCLGVAIRLDSKVSSISFADPPTLVLSIGAIYAADVILGADGLHFTVRSALGHLDPPQLTGELAYRFLVPMAKLSTHATLSKLIENRSIHFWLGPSSHAVCYQIKGECMVNVVLLCPDNMGPFENTVPAAVEETLERLHGWDPHLTLLVKLADNIVKWRLYHSKELSHMGPSKFIGGTARRCMPRYSSIPCSRCSTRDRGWFRSWAPIYQTELQNATS